MKTLTVDGKRYRLCWNEHYQQVEMHGPKLLIGVFLRGGVTLETPREVLVDAARAAIAQDRERARTARERLEASFHDTKERSV